MSPNLHSNFQESKTENTSACRPNLKTERELVEASLGEKHIDSLELGLVGRQMTAMIVLLISKMVESLA